MATSDNVIPVPKFKFVLTQAFLLLVFLLLNQPLLSTSLNHVYLEQEQSALTFLSPQTDNPKLTVTFENESLESVLHEIAQKAGVGISYKKKNLPKKLVTYKAVNTPVFEVLEEVLRGTQLYATLSESREVIIIKKANFLVPELQTGIITGTVTNQDGEPIPTANVLLVEISRGVATNLQGEYTIEDVEAGTYTLRVTFVGYKTYKDQVTIEAGQTLVKDVVLQKGVLRLQQIVVTGTGGPVERRTVGTVIEGINAEDIDKPSVSTISDALKGQIPGLATMGGGGNIGGAVAFQMRGSASIVRGNQPVVYIDGVRVSSGINTVNVGGNPVFKTSRLSDINPENIASIEVLKGAAATTLYGTQASNGVIQIFTKSGSAGETRVRFEITQGISRIPHELVPISATYVDGQILTSDPRSLVLRTGYRQAYNASVRGGSEEVLYYISGAYQKGTAAIIESYVRQYSGRGNVDADITSELHVGVNMFYTKKELGLPGSRNSVRGAYSNAILSFPQARSEERPFGAIFVPIKNATKIRREFDVQHFMGAVNLHYSPVENVNSKLTLGIDLSNTTQVYFQPFGVSVLGSTSGAKRLSKQSIRSTTLDFRTTWSEPLSESFTSRLTVGGQAFFDLTESNFISVKGFAGSGVETVGSASTVTGYGESRINVISAGLFVQEKVGFRNRLFITAGLRLDGHSSFGPNFGLQLYPKLNVSYVISEEKFWDFDFLPLLRLRAAYGTSGLAPAPFEAVRTFVGGTYAGKSAIIPGSPGEPDLKPEKSRAFELGFDAALFDNQWSISFTYFDQKTVDALIPKNFPPSKGFLSPQLVNAGTITNSGIELSTNVLIAQSSDFSWQLRGSLATLTSEVDLGSAAPIRPGYRRYRNYFITGYPPSAFFGSSVDPDNPYDIIVGGEVNPSDLSGFNSISQIRVNVLQNSAGADSLVYLGKPQADVSGNIAMNLTFWDVLEVWTSFAWETGMYTYNLTDGLRANLRIHPAIARIEKELADPSTTAARKRELAAQYAHLSFRAESNWVEESDYIRWGELGVRYTMPEEITHRWFGVRSVTVALTVQNLMLFTSYRGTDPTTNAVGASSLVRNTDFLQAPRPRRFTLTLEVGL